MQTYERTTMTLHDGTDIDCNRCTLHNGRNHTIRGGRNELYITDSVITGDRNTVYGNGNTVFGDRNTLYGDRCHAVGNYNSLYDSSGTSAFQGQRCTVYGATPIVKSTVPTGTTVVPALSSQKYAFSCVPTNSPVVTIYNNSPLSSSPSSSSQSKPVVVYDLTSDEDKAVVSPPPSLIRVESDEVAEENSESACIICLERKRKCAAYPCRHLRYCHTCCLALQQRKNMTCAECRAVVTHFEAFY